MKKWKYNKGDTFVKKNSGVKNTVIEAFSESVIMEDEDGDAFVFSHKELEKYFTKVEPDWL